MYFPYLRGRGAELLALRALATKISLSAKCLPVIEPVNTDIEALKRAIQALSEANVVAAIILNPTVGDLTGSPKKILSAVVDADKNNKIILGISVAANSSIPRLNQVIGLLDSRQALIIHHGAMPDQAELISTLRATQGKVLWQMFRDGRVPTNSQKQLLELGGSSVLFEDKYILRTKNAEYDDYPDEHYSDLVYTFQSSGYQGFGDYLTVSERFSKSGGPAHAVALHLSYPAKKSGGKSIWIRHFVSDEKVGAKNTSGKFLQAVKKFAAFYKANESDLAFSDACKEFDNLFQTKKFPGLPKLKEISLKHHIELMLHEHS